MIFLGNELSSALGVNETMFMSGRVQINLGSNLVITPPAGQYVTITWLAGASPTLACQATVTKTLADNTAFTKTITCNSLDPFIGIATGGNSLLSGGHRTISSTRPITITVPNTPTNLSGAIGMMVEYQFTKII
jgi:hypothetical protein